MADPRHQKLSQVLVNYSLRLQPSDKFLISAQVPAAPLVREVYREALRAGAHPTTRITLDSSRIVAAPFEGLAEVKLYEGSEEQLQYVSDLDLL